MTERNHNELESNDFYETKRGKGGKNRKNRKGTALLAAGALLLSGAVIGGAAVGSFYSAAPAVAGETETFAETGNDIADVTQITGLPDVSDIAQSCMASVVSITNTIEVTTTTTGSSDPFSYFYGNGRGGRTQSETTVEETEAYGSGVIIGQNDTELLILTNNHVSTYDTSGNSYFYQYTASSVKLTVTMPDGKDYEAKLKGSDEEADLAVIAVQLSELEDTTRDAIRIATIGNSDEVKVGQGAIAIGNALGLGQSVTVGYVSALDREVTIEDGYTRTLMQVDAAINQGNSGGGLFNGNGELIGINSAKYSDVGVEGIGYAIPITAVSEIVEGLKVQETRDMLATEDRGYLGIYGEDVSETRVSQYGYPAGAQIVSVTEGSPAAESGLQMYDIITAVNGKKVSDYTGLSSALSYYAPGETVTLTVQRINGNQFEELSIDVTLAQKSSIE
ncbi:MAG: trypsin-like peptidase domain-containing protein [Lachnospiraceae bacterium]|nr:trypsin-like peptidase domain-containing protein [Lachnospiraceae bacterium]